MDTAPLSRVKFAGMDEGICKGCQTVIVILLCVRVMVLQGLDNLVKLSDSRLETVITELLFK